MEQKVALVTGSGKRRIGAHVAQALADRGYKLVLHYRQSREEAERSVAEFAGRGQTAVAVHADLTDEMSVQRMVDAIMSQWGRVDALVNCAALWRRKPLELVTANDLREHFETNTLGTFLCSQKVGLIMVGQSTGGSIVTLGDWATRRPYLGYASYFPSKGAIPTLTRTLAVELGHRNPRVRVNCIHPGPVMLPPDLPEEERREAVEATLVQREGSPAHIVAAVLYLLDNDFVTGDILTVDGGRSIYARGL